MQEWSSGSSGSSPSARIHRRCTGGPGSCCIHGSSPMWRWSIGWGFANHSESSLAHGLESLEQSGQLLGIRHVGHRELVHESTLLVDVERHGDIEDGTAVLDRDDASGGERATVADAVHLVEDRDRGITRAQEVAVQRVDASALDGPARGHQRLRGDLPAEHPLAVLVGADAPEDVDLDRFEIEEFHEKVERFAHRRNPKLPAHPRRLVATVSSRDDGRIS